jgi:hypothetical protein
LSAVSSKRSSISFNSSYVGLLMSVTLRVSVAERVGGRVRVAVQPCRPAVNFVAPYNAREVCKRELDGNRDYGAFHPPLDAICFSFRCLALKRSSLVSFTSCSLDARQGELILVLVSAWHTEL